MPAATASQTQARLLPSANAPCCLLAHSVPNANRHASRAPQQRGIYPPSPPRVQGRHKAVHQSKHRPHRHRLLSPRRGCFAPPCILTIQKPDSMGHTRRIPRISPPIRADTRAQSSGRRRRGRGVFGSTSAGRGRVRGVATGSSGGGRRRRAGRYVRGHRRGGGRWSVVAPAAGGVAATPFRAIPRQDASLRQAWRVPLQAEFEAGMAIPAGSAPN